VVQEALALLVKWVQTRHLLIQQLEMDLTLLEEVLVLLVLVATAVPVVEEVEQAGPREEPVSLLKDSEGELRWVLEHPGVEEAELAQLVQTQLVQPVVVGVLETPLQLQVRL
jgi:hypothetical protein